MKKERKKKNIIELTRMTMEDALKSHKFEFIILLEDVRSLHNVGSVLRTADALGVKEVIMAGITGVPPHSEIEKTALGAEKSVKWRHVESALEEINDKKREGWKIYVLEQAHNSVNLAQWQPGEDEKIFMVVGNEVRGVSQEVIDISDVCLEIPQVGAKHSMNVSVSAGIGMWQALKGKLKQ